MWNINLHGDSLKQWRLSNTGMYFDETMLVEDVGMDSKAKLLSEAADNKINT